MEILNWESDVSPNRYRVKEDYGKDSLHGQVRGSFDTLMSSGHFLRLPKIRGSTKIDANFLSFI